jgi:hypothetical protein
MDAMDANRQFRIVTNGLSYCIEYTITALVFSWRNLSRRRVVKWHRAYNNIEFEGSAGESIYLKHLYLNFESAKRDVDRLRVLGDTFKYGWKVCKDDGLIDVLEESFGSTQEDAERENLELASVPPER